MKKSNSAGANGEMLRMDVEHVFKFKCAPDVPCFTDCCRDITIVLSPYDVLRLKNALNIHSDEFLDRHTIIIRRENLLIPMVVLKMNEDDKRCPFVTEKGCSVYADRPWPCRMYPLNMNDDGTFSLITDSSRCKGLEEDDKNRISTGLLNRVFPCTMK